MAQNPLGLWALASRALDEPPPQAFSDDARLAGVVMLAAAFVVVLLLFVFIGNVLVNIGGDEVGVLERRYLGRGLPEGHVIAMRGEIGQSTRIGISRDAHRLLRFYLRDSPFVSGPRTLNG